VRSLQGLRMRLRPGAVHGLYTRTMPWIHMLRPTDKLAERTDSFIAASLH